MKENNSGTIMDETQLTKKERRELAKEQKMMESQRKDSSSKILKLVVWAVVAAVVVGGIYWFTRDSEKPLPGTAVADQGREHIPDGTPFDYNSNPPTSGSHYAEWTRAGIYETPVSDGHLIHALEHGYIIISYNCKTKNTGSSLVKEVYAHDEELEKPNDATESGEESQTLEGSEWGSDECQQLVEKLTGIYDKKGKRKTIIIPRPQLDAKIALTAWTRIDKFNDFDEDRIISFINAYRDKGPEQTAE